MNTTILVSVFESDSQQEIDLVKGQLEAKGLKPEVRIKEMAPFTDLTVNVLTLSVNLIDEQKAFAVIDAWLQESDHHLQDPTSLSN